MRKINSLQIQYNVENFDEIHVLSASVRNWFSLFYILAIFQEFFHGGGGGGGESIVMKIFLAMLTFLLFSDQISGGQTASGGRPAFPCRRKPALGKILVVSLLRSFLCACSPLHVLWQSFVTLGSCNHLMRVILTYVGNKTKSEVS